MEEMKLGSSVLASQANTLLLTSALSPVFCFVFETQFQFTDLELPLALAGLELSNTLPQTTQ